MLTMLEFNSLNKRDTFRRFKITFLIFFFFFKMVCKDYV